MEVEVKARIKDIGSVRKSLESAGAKFDGSVEHTDAYFKARGFEKKLQGPGDWILRIRTGSGKTALTMKVLTELLGAWVEYETAIENPEQTRRMLETMGMANVFTLNKKRICGRLGEFEVLLDDVKELGKYLEVSLDSEEKEGARKRILKFMKKIGIEDDDIEKRGYGEIIGEKMGHRFGGMR
ncbi:MAG: class IV adenylate cyclase [Candidatus Aenigmarchaeota archaeon]|nr:class IV adenylate cyclase [Candidatus Aenigmarchaeota archaeon]